MTCESRPLYSICLSSLLLRFTITCGRKCRAKAAWNGKPSLGAFLVSHTHTGYPTAHVHIIRKSVAPADAEQRATMRDTTSTSPHYALQITQSKPHNRSLEVCWKERQVWTLIPYALCAVRCGVVAIEIFKPHRISILFAHCCMASRLQWQWHRDATPRSAPSSVSSLPARSARAHHSLLHLPQVLKLQLVVEQVEGPGNWPPLFKEELELFEHLALGVVLAQSRSCRQEHARRARACSGESVRVRGPRLGS